MMIMFFRVIYVIYKNAASICVSMLLSGSPIARIQRCWHTGGGVPATNTLPPALLRELHYQMITLGKVFCTKRQPNCGGCPVRGVCEYANHRGPRWQPREAVQCSDIEETIPADTAGVCCGIKKKLAEFFGLGVLKEPSEKWPCKGSCCMVRWKG